MATATSGTTTHARALADVILVPHTHWDREWYEPFQRFRLRLVDLLDEVLDRAEAEPELRFTLDGQTAAVDDYLEVRPENGDRLAALVRGGRLAVGPWQILADEFLCSGETLIRNLERGWRRATDLGAAMPVGYLPDMFGHCAQMPQILAGAGLLHACLWRGVPSSVAGHAFRWEAPDGSSVRTEYLPGGYGNAAHLFADPTRLAERAERLAEELGPLFGSDPVLAMYGTDHSAPVRGLVRYATGLADRRVRLHLATLSDYVTARDPGEPGLPLVRGELRSHARANILPGVLSVRVPLKNAMGVAERVVERYAEPFAALWSDDWPGRFLDMAWDRLVASSCHDSVTGCGVDETALQVAARIAEAEHLGQAVVDRVVAGVGQTVPSDALLVMNPTATRRRDLVRVDVAVPDEWPAVVMEMPDGSLLPTQDVARTARVLRDEVVDARDLTRVFRGVHGRELYGRQVTGWELDESDRVLTFHLAREPGDQPFDAEDARLAAEAAAVRATGPWRLRIIDEARRVIDAQVDVPPLGWVSARPSPGHVAARHPVRAEDSTLDNGLLRVAVREDGGLRLESPDGTVLDDVGRVVDEGDCGDTYNYGPPGDDLQVEDPSRVEIRVEEVGPLRGVVVVTRRYTWPEDADLEHGRRTSEAVESRVGMRVELRADEPFVRLDVTVDNRSRDHRVRLHIPTTRRAATSCAEGQLAVVERGRSPEGGHGEHPLPTYPAHAFVDAGGVAVLLTRASEYELVDDPRTGGTALALTLLRAVGMLSRNVHPYREEAAGPEIPTPAAQCLGETTTRLAVMPHSGDWSAAAVVEAAERFRHPLHVRSGLAAPGGALDSSAGLEVAGDGVVLSSLRRRDGSDAVELRLVAETPVPAKAVVSGQFVRATRVDLLGRTREPVAVTDQQVTLPMRPWEIATLRLE